MSKWGWFWEQKGEKIVTVIFQQYYKCMSACMRNMNATWRLLTSWARLNVLTLTHDPKQPYLPKSTTTLLLALGTIGDFHPLISLRWLKAQNTSRILSPAGKHKGSSKLSMLMMKSSYCFTIHLLNGRVRWSCSCLRVVGFRSNHHPCFKL